jgi:hypothetical protein
MGITGNTAVDAIAKAGVTLPISNAEISHTDFKPLMSSHVLNCWQLCWNSDTNNKLFKIQPVIKSVIVNRLLRRDEIFIVCVSDTHILGLPTHTCDCCAVKLHQSAIFATFV